MTSYDPSDFGDCPGEVEDRDDVQEHLLDKLYDETLDSRHERLAVSDMPRLPPLSRLPATANTPTLEGWLLSRLGPGETRHIMTELRRRDREIEALSTALARSRRLAFDSAVLLRNEAKRLENGAS